MRSLSSVLEDYPNVLGRGLTEPEVRASRAKHGSNRLTPLPRQPLWLRFLEKFDEPIIKILLAAALLSMLVQLLEPPADSLCYVLFGVVLTLLVGVAIATRAARHRHWLPVTFFLTAVILWPLGLALAHTSFDGLAVMAAVVLATGVTFASEYRSEREFDLLNTQRESVKAKVLRGGEVCTIPFEDVVVGERILLETGDEICADGRLVRATDLQVDQSLMTGEAEPVPKRTGPLDDSADGPDRPDALYRGTQIVHGLAEMIALDVGDATYLGRIARSLSQKSPSALDVPEGRERVQRKLAMTKDLTPLQVKLERLARTISKAGYLAATVIFLTMIVRGLVRGELRWPPPDEDWAAVMVDNSSRLLSYFMYMVIVIVVAVPEGLPMSVTVSLALAMRKMTRANCLVRQLSACETIGSTTIICTDKTGTLTKNRMQVVRVSTANTRDQSSMPAWQQYKLAASWPGKGGPVDWMIVNAAVNSTANLSQTRGLPAPVGNSTEGALLLWLNQLGVDYRELRQRFGHTYQVPFSSEQKRMTSVLSRGQDRIVLVKGSPEWLVEHSIGYVGDQGEEHAWTDEARESVLAQLALAAGQALRTLAFAHRVTPAWDSAAGGPDDEAREELERDLVFAGFVTIQDPLRGDVREALHLCRRAGIEVLMITGDSTETAYAISAQIGLLDRPDALALAGKDLEVLSDSEVKQRLPRLRVLARARPLDKLRLVKLLQELGEVVAVTGDGTNDAPALKRADVGLAMGRTGTPVAKEASKIILLDDAFSTIVKGVRWGRALYENIQRFVQFQLTINVSALSIAFLGPLLGVQPPFTVLQLLWINIIMDTFASIALCSEPPRSGLMRLPPKRRDESILSPGMRWNIFATAAFFIVVMLALLLAMKGTPTKPGWFALAADGSGRWSGPFPDFTLRQVSIFFTTYVMFQVWNEINCRSLTPETSGLRRLWQNPTFLGIIVLIVAGQWLIVTFGGALFQVERLRWLDWLMIAGATTSVLVYAELLRWLRLGLAIGVSGGGLRA
jgi:Ca2+-transporting ATPase